MTQDNAGSGGAGMSWQAGDLSLDVGLQRLERAGESIELPKLSFELLLVLFESAPNFVSNDELMTRVWKNLVVSPETVTQRVKLLRDALGDDPRNPRYGEGLRGRGYRLIPEARRAGRIEPIAAAAPVPPLAPPIAVAATPAPALSRLRWAWALALPIVALTLAGAWVLQQRESPPLPARAESPSDRTAAILTFVSEAEQQGGAGLADSIAARLAEVRGLTVISRYSSQALDPQALGATETGNRLGARYLVQGTLLRQGTQLRVTATLTDSQTGRQVWTQQFTRPVEDAFGMQDEVAEGVKRALESRIADLDPGLPAIERSANREAWLAYLRGRNLLGRTTVVGADAAIREFEQAVELDPQFVPAIAGLYDARMQSVSLRRGDLLDSAGSLRPGCGDDVVHQWQPQAGRAGQLYQL